MAGLAVVGCSGGSGAKSADGVADAAAADTVAAVETPKEVFTSPDLTFADVKGHVKKITDTYDGKEYSVYEFDSTGVFTVRQPLEAVQKLSRDAEGRITGGDNGYYTVTWRDGKVTETVYNESDGTLLSDSYKYDADGNLAETVSKSEGPDGDYSWTLTYTYGPDAFDDHGNWIKRNVHSTEDGGKDFQQTRKIYYY